MILNISESESQAHVKYCGGPLIVYKLESTKI